MNMRAAGAKPPGYQLALEHYWQTVTAGFGQVKAADQYARAHAAEYARPEVSE